MHRIVPSLAFAALLVPLTGALEPAKASSSWFAGVDFAVGGVDFSLGFSDLDLHHDGPHYYYQTGAHLAYRGYMCDSACYIRDDRYYHHPECPIVFQHFDRHGFDPYPAWTALPNRGVLYYPRHHGPERHGDHHGRRHGGRRGRGRSEDWRDDHSDSDSDSDSDRRQRHGGRG